MAEIAEKLGKSRIVVKQKIIHLELKEEGGVKTVPSSYLVLPDELSFTSLNRVGIELYPQASFFPNFPT